MTTNKIKYILRYLIIFFYFLLFFSINSYCQSSISSINLDKIFQKRKIKFIKNNYLKKTKSFLELYPTCYEKEDIDNYNIQNDSYIVDEDINVLWNQYKNIDLKSAYSGKLVKFGFLYSTIKNKLVYINDDYSGLEVGQIVFIRLDLLKGIKKLVVAYEVTDIDDENKSIQFCYIKNGISEGSQTISLSNTQNGKTKITHNTIFKSNSKFRDKWIYPKFHRRVVKELHKNLISSLK